MNQVLGFGLLVARCYYGGNVTLITGRSCVLNGENTTQNGNLVLFYRLKTRKKMDEAISLNLRVLQLRRILLIIF